MTDDDAGAPTPRHRRPGKARKRGSSDGGRHLRLIPATEADAAAPGRYPVEDLAGMSPGAVQMLLHRAGAETENGADAVLHVVITHDLESGTVSESGPFPSGPDALAAAQRFVEQNRALDPHWRFRVRVKPVLTR